MVIDLTEDILKLSTVHSDLVHVFTLYKLFFFFFNCFCYFGQKTPKRPIRLTAFINIMGMFLQQWT